MATNKLILEGYEVKEYFDLKDRFDKTLEKEVKLGVEINLRTESVSKKIFGFVVGVFMGILLVGILSMY